MAWAIAAFDVAVFVVASIADPVGDLFAAAVFLAAIIGFCGVGALLIARVPRNPIGSLLLLSGTLMSIGSAAGIYATIASRPPGAPAPMAAWAALANQVLFLFPIVIVLVLVPLLFPTGRLMSRRWRAVIWITVIGMGCYTVQNLFQPGLLGAAELANPMGSAALVDVVAVAGTIATLSALPAFIGAAASVVVRFRRGDSVEREQLKWLMATAAVTAIAFPGSLLLGDTPAGQALLILTFLALIALPVAIGIAILRYRLYEIDRIVSRTISYAIVSGILGATFVATILAVQTLLESVTRSPTIAVAASTLVAFALFQPVRRRVQAVVDERFDRARVDGERTAADFREHLRHEIDIATIADELLTTIDGAVRPTSRSLWLREGGR